MFNISIYQFILIIISTAFITTYLIKFIKRESGQTFFKLISTEIVWASILVLAISPALSRSLSRFFGFGENLNTLIFIGFVVVFLIIFKLLNSIEKIERNLSEIVREEALKNIKNKK